MTLKTNNVQLGTNATADKNIVLASDSTTGDLVISKGNHDGVLTEISRISNAGGGQVYVPAGTGAVESTVQTKLRESVSVKDFGAVGDGVTDDTTAIQAAIDAFPVDGTTKIGGCTLFFPRGTYMVSTLTWKQSISAFGEGHYSSIIKANTNSTTALVLFQDIARVSIRDMQFDGNNKCADTFRLRATGTTGSMLFEHLDLHGATTYTVHVMDDGSGAPDDIAHIVFNHCYLRSDPSPALTAQYKNGAANGFHITFLNGILSSRNNASTYNCEIREGMTTFIDTFFAGATTADILSYLNGQVKVIGGRSESTGPFFKSEATESGLSSSLPHSIEGFNYAGGGTNFAVVQGTKPIWINSYYGLGNIYADTGSTVHVGLIKGGSITEAGSPVGSVAKFGQERGTWTPVIRGDGTAGTYEQAAGTCATYIKDGNLVTLNCWIVLAGAITGGGTGEMIITGAPYTKSNNTWVVGPMRLNGVAFTANTAPVLQFAGTAETSTMYCWLNTGSGGSYVPISAVGAGDGISFSITYETDA